MASIDAAVCAARLKRLMASWSDNAQVWGGATALLVGSGANKEDDLRYLKSVALEIWLFGYELPDTLVLITKAGELHVVTGGKKAKLVETVVETVAADAGVKVVVHNKPKGENGEAQADELVECIPAGALVGMVAKEASEGALTAYAAEKIKAKGFSVVEVAPGVADAMAVKDDAELVLVKQAARLSTKAMGWTVERVEGIVNDETKVSHAKLSEECEDQILDPAKKLGLKDIEADDVDICYPPIVQSGGEYELKMSAQSSDKKLHYGVVAISLGARHTQYCTNIARTLMIDPTKPMEDVYAAVLAAQEAALGALKDGADLAAPYDAAKAARESAEGVSDDTRAALVSKLGKNVGTAIGLELREPSLVLGPKSRGAVQKVRAGQCYNIQIAIAGLTNEKAKEGSKGRTYAVLIADTAVVAANGAAPEVLTAGVTNGRWSVDLYGENLFNEKAELARNYVNDVERVTLARPLTVGVRASFDM